ncbi:maleylpyruvate isomerase family mycothiol-dependent enzyme [Kitasatospora purpeofusca]|uniref:maleylpyruvate isomerase family mycothiol-dependent enzyme n=1 Tax=Kitasatospora purpeofusca TaxID=67352 RepID=UPI0022557D58|nr:maleylpyruvate isomerase family mycothiol-dependent enzyme [Kitasatospora purpeofusca]MCX4689274.1 maleylpyruvate isomerase family mycothiol-dependent enzyme [Kitasatospora purpeofusca]
MEITAHIDALRHEGGLFADAAARTELDAPVPTCPEWRLRDLVLHTGHVHRWATAHLRDGRPAPMDEASQQAIWAERPDDAVLVDWFRAGHGALVDTLLAAPADLDCWTFLPTAPSPLAFWARRQAHETAMHRIDADAAAGTEGPATAPELALDGIDELLRGFLSLGRSRLRSEQPRTVLVGATDGPGRWLLTVSGEPLSVELTEGPADLTLTGPARDLYLMLWNRLPAGTGRVEHSGDEALLDLWRETATIG